MDRTPAEIAMWDQALASIKANAEAFRGIWRISKEANDNYNDALREAIVHVAAETLDAIEANGFYETPEIAKMLITNIIGVNFYLISKENDGA